MCILLMLAGHETTTNLIGNGLLALLQNRDQLERLHADSGMIETAVEDFLRYESPIQSAARIAMEDIEIGGQRIDKGQRVTLMLGAANRDRERFSNPDRLDITREDNRHLSLGFGPHFCLGSALAAWRDRSSSAPSCSAGPACSLPETILSGGTILRSAALYPCL